MTTEEQHSDAVLAVLTTGDAVPFTIQGTKRVQALPLAYNEVTVEPRFGGPLRLTARSTRRGYRIAIESKGKTYDKAADMRDKADAALRFAELVIDGKRSTPVQFETSNPIEDPEDGWYSGVTLYTYVV